MVIEHQFIWGDPFNYRDFTASTLAEIQDYLRQFKDRILLEYERQHKKKTLPTTDFNFISLGRLVTVRIPASPDEIATGMTGLSDDDEWADGNGSWIYYHHNDGVVGFDLPSPSDGFSFVL